MRIKLYEIILVIAFGVLLPAMLISYMQKDESIPVTTETEAEPVQVPEKAEYIVIMHADGVVREMELSEYLVAVILREMPARFELEALKAQAVVARTYALKHKDSSGRHSPADICTQSSCCQGFYSVNTYLTDGGKQENVEKIRSAVLATDGEVLMYNEKLIDATYFSCSGGMTEDALAVWGTDIPYLQATVSPGEESAKHYIDTVTFNREQFADALDLDNTKQLTVDYIRYTEGGGIDTISLCGKVLKGTTLRKKLDLNSTAVLLSVVGDTVTVTTKGNGHRVGMSQYGANAMATDGATYQQILMHYYNGVELVKNTVD